MKKTYFKKSMSVFMAVLMILSCWVFVAPEHNHASAAYDAVAVEKANKTAVEGISIDTSFTTIHGSFESDSDYLDTQYYDAIYHNVLYTDGPVSIAASATSAKTEYGSSWTGSNGVTVYWYHPTATLIYEGDTSNYPRLGVAVNTVMYYTGTWSRKTVNRLSYISSGGNGFTFNQNWRGSDGRLNFNYMWHGQSELMGYTSTVTNSSMCQTLNGNSDNHFYANLLKFTATMSDTEYWRSAQPTFGFYGDNGDDAKTITAKTGDTLYVINYVPLKKALNAANTALAEINANAKMYTTESVAKYAELAKALIAARPNNYINSTKNDVAGWGNAAKTAVDNWNAWTGLEKVSFTVNFYDEDQTTLLKSQKVSYGENATPPSNPSKALDTYNHYSFAGWSGNYTNVTNDATVIATYNGTKHDFSGIYSTDTDAMKHKRKCTGCDAYGMNGEKDKYVSCTGTWGGNDTTHSFTCECSKTYSHKPTEEALWHNSTASKYRVTGDLTPEQACITPVVYKVSCSVCGLAHTTNTFTVAAAGHAWGYASHVDHTCTADGYDVYRCSKCGTTENRTDSKYGQPGTDPAAHDWDTQRSDKGNGEHGYKCKKCDAWDQSAPHEYELTTIYTDSTCTTEGHGKYTCKLCPYSYEDVIPVKPHDFDTSKYVSIDDTNHGYKCKNCDHYDGITAHVYTDKSETVTEPTCYEAGLAYDYCVCGHYVERVIPATGNHTWSEDYKEHDGGHARYCTFGECDAWDTVESHDAYWKLTETTKAPTCIHDGEGVYTCTLCGATKTDVIPFDGKSHDYKNPVSNGNGKHTASCGYCNAQIDEDCFDNNNDCICDVCKYEIPHKYDNIVRADLLVSEADCNSYAVYYKSCSVCGHSEKDATATFEDVAGGYGAHDWTESDEFLASAAACEKDATYYYKCSECGGSSETLGGGATWTDKGSALKHIFEADATNSNVVNNNNGTHSYTCQREDCNEVGYGSKVGASTDCIYEAPYYVEGETENHYEKCECCGYIKTTAHDMTSWTPDAANQGDAQGKHTRYCPDCNYSEIADCTYGEAVVTDATCMHGKIETYTCTVCAHSYSINDGIVNPDNHDYGTWFDEETAIESTCTVAGKYADEKCSGCNEVINVGADRPLDPKNHADYETEVVGTIEATCIIEGHTGKTICKECQATLIEDVNLGFNPNNHKNMETGAETPPTCEDYGYTDYTKCLDCGKITGKAKEEPLGHDYTGDVVVLDGDKHAYECKNGCGTHGVGIVKWKTEACSGGTATCETEATCDVCKDKWGKKEMHVFEGDYVKVPGEDAHNQKCKNCDAYGIGTSYETGDSVACSGGKANCTDKAVCKYCGEEYGSALGHNFTASKDRLKSYENGEHNYKCLRCDLYGAIVDDVHTVDAVIKCSDNDPITTVATCTDDAYTTYVCDACSYEWVVTEEDSALGHKYEQKLVNGAHLKSAADCVNAATYWYDCVRCDTNAKDAPDAETNENYYYTYGSANGHKWDAEVQEEEYFCAAATCTTNECYYVSCSVCDISSEGTDDEATFEVPNTKSGHNWEATETFPKKAASCGVNAEFYYECTNTGCGVSSEKADNGKFWIKEDSALEHTYTEQIEDVAHRKNVANCERGATYYYDCKYCDDNAKLLENAEDYTFESSVKDPANHTNLTTVEYLAPTCTTEGHYAYKQCSGCGYESEITVIPAKEHDFTGKVEHIAGTDTHKVACANKCGEYGPAVDCDFGDTWTQIAGTATHEQTCECGNKKTGNCTGGTSSCAEQKTCDLCGGKYGETSDHDYTDVEWVKDKNADTHSKKCKNCNTKITEDCSGGDEPTCSSKSVCDVCEEEYGEYAQHVMGDTEVITPADCLNNRVEETKCTNYENCGHKVTQTVPNSSLGHSMGEFAITTQPTCKDEGVQTRRCLRTGCTYTESQTIPADKSKHVSEGPFVESGAGDCTTGIKYYNKCKVCDEILKEWSEVGQHEWKAVVETKPNCITDGYINYECEKCGFTKTEWPEELKANGTHTWSKQITDATQQYAQWVDVDKDGVRDADEYFTVNATKHPSCKNAGRGYMVCTICKDHSENVEIDKLVHGPEADLADNGILDDTVIVEAVAPTCERAGHNSYWRCLNCSYSQYNDDEWRKENIIPATGHIDNTNDGKCDDCHGLMYDSDGNNKDDSSCGCMCHNDSWLMQLFYKIFRFFWKLFKTNQSCACGFQHY